jgi:hypothetical protein
VCLFSVNGVYVDCQRSQKRDADWLVLTSSVRDASGVVEGCMGLHHLWCTLCTQSYCVQPSLCARSMRHERYVVRCRYLQPGVGQVLLPGAKSLADRAGCTKSIFLLQCSGFTSSLGRQRLVSSMAVSLAAAGACAHALPCSECEHLLRVLAYVLCCWFA